LRLAAKVAGGYLERCQPALELQPAVYIGPNHSVVSELRGYTASRHAEQGVIGFGSLKQSLRREPQFPKG